MSNIKIFEDKKVRVEWDENQEDWLFSVVDIVEVLTESSQPRKYWNDLKRKLKQEGSELSEKIGQLKMIAHDGKFRETDVLDTKGMLRLIQSVPSKKAEPFKVWLAQVGSERLDEISDPQKAIDRGVDFYRKKGYPEEWITQRMMTIKTRKELTDEWQERGITKEKDYAILTNEMTKAWSGLSVQQYKEHKNLKKENLRDNMTTIELVLNMLAEVTTTGLSKQEKPKTFEENKQVAKRGGNIARNARLDYEQQLGKSVISSNNAKDKQLLQYKPKK